MQKQKNKNSNKINNGNHLNYTNNNCSWSHTINRIISLYYRKFTNKSFLYSFLKPLILTIILSLGYLAIYTTTFVHIIFITLFLGFSSYYRYKSEITKFTLFNYGLIASVIFSYNMLLIGNYSVLIHTFDTILFTGLLTRIFVMVGEIH